MADPLFSIVLPTYNRADMLRSAIKSVLWQTCGDYECFVLDNCSTDATPAVFAEFAATPKFFFKRFDKNRGVQQSRNYAVGRARGRYITFLDSDDLWLPERLEAFAELIRARPSAGFIFSNAYEFRYGRIIGTLFDPRRAIPEGRVPGWYAVGEDPLPYVTTNLALKQEAFATTGLYRTDVALLDDTELYSRMLADGLEVAAIARPLAVRTLHANQLTHGYEQAFRDDMDILRGVRTPPEIFERYRRTIGLQVAAHLFRAGKPSEARRFLAEQGLRAGWRGLALGVLARLPAAPVLAARRARRLALELRCGPLAPAEFRRVTGVIDPLLGPHRPAA